jgi:hypothetical protein
MPPKFENNWHPAEVVEQSVKRTPHLVLLQEYEKARTHHQTTGLNHQDASPFYGNYVQQKCNCSDARTTPSGRDPIQERISAILESQLHSCPSEPS